MNKKLDLAPETVEGLKEIARAAEGNTDERVNAVLFDSRQMEYLRSLKTLGMCCLVQTEYGAAFASEFMLTLNDDETGWRHATATNPFARCLRPEVLNGYADDWKTSLVVLDSFLPDDRHQASPSVGSKLRAPEDAPRDGTMFLAAVGWPWLVPAVWDCDSHSWAVCTPNAETLGDDVICRYWETDTEPPAHLLGWMPWPDLPGGYVFRPAND